MTPILPDDDPLGSRPDRTPLTPASNLAQDPGEPFDIVTADGRPTGVVKPRGRVHRDGDWHRALHVWVAGRDNRDGAFLTFQRRAAGKDTWPGRLDATVGGHVRAGETITETMREIDEEIGVAPEGLALRPLGTRICANEAVPGILDRELQEVYLLLDNRRLTAFRPNPAELAALVRFPLDGLIPFLAGENPEVAGVSIAPGAIAPAPFVAHQDDFIPTVDRYALRVALAAHNVLRGDTHVVI